MEENILELDGIFKKGYGFIAKMVMQDNQLSLQSKGIYAYLCSYSGKGKDSFPSRKKMCFDLNISDETLGKYLKELKEKEYIQIKQTKTNNKFSNNIYKINLNFPCTEILGTEISDTKNLGTNNNNINNNNSNNNKIKINKKELKEKEKNFDDVFNKNNFSNELKEALKDFIRMRKTIKRPMTTRALELLLNELNKLTNLEEEKVAIINQSIVNSWQTVYPLKNQEEKLKFDKIKSSKEKEEQIEFSADILTNEEYGRLLNGELPREELKQIVLERTGG